MNPQSPKIAPELVTNEMVAQVKLTAEERSNLLENARALRTWAQQNREQFAEIITDTFSPLIINDPEDEYYRLSSEIFADALMNIRAISKIEGIMLVVEWILTTSPNTSIVSIPDIFMFGMTYVDHLNEQVPDEIAKANLLVQEINKRIKAKEAKDAPPKH